MNVWEMPQHNLCIQWELKYMPVSDKSEIQNIFFVKLSYNHIWICSQMIMLPNGFHKPSTRSAQHIFADNTATVYEQLCLVESWRKSFLHRPMCLWVVLSKYLCYKNMLDILFASSAEKTSPCESFPFVLASCVQPSEMPRILFQKRSLPELPDIESFCGPIDTTFISSADLYLRDASRSAA